MQNKAGAEELDEEEMANLIIDSLMAIEIQSWDRRNIGVEINLVRLARRAL